MTDRSFYTEENANRAFKERVAQIKKNYDARKLRLENMQTAQLRALANEYELPQDLNHTELVKYILLKEFPSR